MRIGFWGVDMAKAKGNFIKYVTAAAIFVLAFTLSFALLNAGNTASAQTEGNDAYWSKTNRPIFYGATRITLAKNAIDSFDIKDSRFRLFAKDFEDGDLENAIKCTGQDDVDPSVPGEYKLNYSVTDSHFNKTELEVVVEVTEDEDNLIDVVRTMYLIPNDWNMTVAGFSRCNGGDRQILGIYLPDGASFEMKVLSAAEELRQKCNISGLTVAMLNDDARRETAVTVPVTPSQEAQTSDGFVRVTNDYKDDNHTNDSYAGNYASVPFLSSNKLLRGVNVNTTFKFEIRYKADEAHKLNYYHYGDRGGGEQGEESFTSEWYASGDSHGVLENEVLTVLVPKEDMPKLHSNEGGFVFENIDAFLSYYQNVVDRMDKIIGLDFNPKKPTDQNLRAKYIVKANAHGAGAAYYAGNHVGINSKVADERYPNGLRGQMYAFFQMNWGGLHEIAHGYQGGLGGGSMGLGEVSNNILGYYIQCDQSLYTYRGNIWLGDIHNKANEEKQNRFRLNAEDPQGLLDIKDANDAVVVKLYFLVNLFEAFEGEDTYAKLFSLYREERAEGKNSNQQDFYVHFFAKEYDANVAPYFEQWGVPISQDVMEEVYKAGRAYSILGDTAGEYAEQIIEGEGKQQLYGLVENAELEKYGVKGSLTVAVDGALTDGRTFLLTRGDVAVAQATSSVSEVKFENVAAGTYMLRAPVIDGYTATMPIVTVEQGGSRATVTYTKQSASYHSVRLYVAGIRGTLGWSLTLTSPTEGTIDLGAAELGNRDANWQARPNDVYISATIKDASGKDIYSHIVKGDNYFVLRNESYGAIKLGEGYTVEIYTHKPQLVTVRSLVKLNDKGEPTVMDGFTSDLSEVETTLVYTVTSDGLVPSFKDDFDLKDELYGAIRDVCLQNVEDLANYFEENAGVLTTKYLDRSKKDEFEMWYAKMSDEDRQAYRQIHEAILRGGVPSLSVKESEVTVKNAAEIDWNAIFEAVDAEDGAIALNAERIELIFDGSLANKGSYRVGVCAFDSDGNASAPVYFTLNILEGSKGLGDGEGLPVLGIALIAVVSAIVVAGAIIVALFAVKSKKQKKTPHEF